MCPRCGAPLPPGATHESVTCAFCGTTSAVADLANEAQRSNLVCPRCEQKLFFGDAEGVTLAGCGVCGGIWLDNEAAQKVTHHYSERVVEMATRASESAHQKPDVRAAAKCAQCRAEMARRTFGQVSVDVCAEHGTWFDAGELSALVSATKPLPPPPTGMAASEPTPDFRASSGIGGDAVVGALEVAGGAFGLLLDILSD